MVLNSYMCVRETEILTALSCFNEFSIIFLIKVYNLVCYCSFLWAPALFLPLATMVTGQALHFTLV